MIRKFVLFVSATLFIVFMVMLDTGFSALNERWAGLRPEEPLDSNIDTHEIVEVQVQIIDILNEKEEDVQFAPKELRPVEVKVKLAHAPKVGEPVKLTLMASNVVGDRGIYVRAWTELWYGNAATGNNGGHSRQNLFNQVGVLLPVYSNGKES